MEDEQFKELRHILALLKVARKQLNEVIDKLAGDRHLKMIEAAEAHLIDAIEVLQDIDE